jgi:hypothetical protein
MRNLLLAIAFAATAVLNIVTPSNSQPAAQDVKGCMEGVYVLEEFKKDGEVFKPPQVAGRYVVLNGVVLFIFHDRTQQSKQTSNIGFGTYTISSTAYAYHYDDYALYTHTSAETSVSRQPPWEGMRSFVTVFDQDGMHLRNPNEPRDEFLCSSDGLVYTFGSGNYRRYRRTKSE